MPSAEVKAMVTRDFPGLRSSDADSLFDGGFDTTPTNVQMALARGFSEAEKADCKSEPKVTIRGSILANPRVLRNHSVSVTGAAYCWPDYKVGDRMIAWESSWFFQAPPPPPLVGYPGNYFVRQMLLRFQIGYNPRSKERVRQAECFNESFRIDGATGRTTFEDKHELSWKYDDEHAASGDSCMTKCFEVGYLQLVVNDQIPSGDTFSFYGGSGAWSKNGGNSWWLGAQPGSSHGGPANRHRRHDRPTKATGSYTALYAPCHCGFGAYPEPVPRRGDPEAPLPNPTPLGSTTGETGMLSIGALGTAGVASGATLVVGGGMLPVGAGGRSLDSPARLRAAVPEHASGDSPTHSGRSDAH